MSGTIKKPNQIKPESYNPEQYPSLVNPNIRTAIERLGKNVPGANHSQLYLHECVDPAITDFSIMRDHAIREKVATYIERLKKIDQEIFDCLIETEDKQYERNY